MITTSEKNFITTAISLAFKYFVNVTLNIRHIHYQNQASVYSVGQFHYYYRTAGCESQTKWFQLSDQQPELTTAGLIWFRQGRVVAFQTLKHHQWWERACKKMQQVSKHKPRLPKYYFKKYTVGNKTLKGKLENKVDFGINLPLASGQKSYCRAMSDLQLVCHLTMAKVIFSKTDHVYVSAGYIPNVKGSNCYSTLIWKICHTFLHQRIVLTKKK